MAMEVPRQTQWAVVVPAQQPQDTEGQRVFAPKSISLSRLFAMTSTGSLLGAARREQYAVNITLLDCATTPSLSEDITNLLPFVPLLRINFGGDQAIFPVRSTNGGPSMAPTSCHLQSRAGLLTAHGSASITVSLDTTTLCWLPIFLAMIDPLPGSVPGIRPPQTILFGWTAETGPRICIPSTPAWLRFITAVCFVGGSTTQADQIAAHQAALRFSFDVPPLYRAGEDAALPVSGGGLIKMNPQPPLTTTFSPSWSYFDVAIGNWDRLVVASQADPVASQRWLSFPVIAVGESWQHQEVRVSTGAPTANILVDLLQILTEMTSNGRSYVQAYISLSPNNSEIANSTCNALFNITLQ